MAFEVVLLDAAEEEIDNSFLWYESQLLGLGDKFIHYVSKGIDFISKHPFASELKYKGVRRYVMNKFPYGIYYIIDSAKKEIRVIGVVHFNQNGNVNLTLSDDYSL